MQSDKTLTPREAAVILGCGMKRLYELLYAQKIPATKVKSRWAIPASAVESRVRETQNRHGH